MKIAKIIENREKSAKFSQLLVKFFLFLVFYFSSSFFPPRIRLRGTPEKTKIAWPEEQTIEKRVFVKIRKGLTASEIEMELVSNRV